jgi:hypothetical protein
MFPVKDPSKLTSTPLEVKNKLNPNKQFKNDTFNSSIPPPDNPFQLSQQNESMINAATQLDHEDFFSCKEHDQTVGKITSYYLVHTELAPFERTEGVALEETLASPLSTPNEEYATSLNKHLNSISDFHVLNSIDTSTKDPTRATIFVKPRSNSITPPRVKYKLLRRRSIPDNRKEILENKFLPYNVIIPNIVRERWKRRSLPAVKSCVNISFASAIGRSNAIKAAKSPPFYTPQLARAPAETVDLADTGNLKRRAGDISFLKSSEATLPGACSSPETPAFISIGGDVGEEVVDTLMMNSGST